MPLGMSEKIDNLIESNLEIQKSYVVIQQNHKTLIALMKGFFAGCAVFAVYIASFMINTKSDIDVIKATLATTDNITTLREEYKCGDKKLHDEMGVYISLISYLAIENQRSLVLADAFCDMGRQVNIKDEELERFRNTIIFKLNNSVNLGTVRGKEQ